jgi:hypothetical protein
MPENQRSQRLTVLGSRAVVLLLLAAATALVVYKVNITIARGPGWDTYAFLNNAAEFAGQGTGYTELHRPPFLSWLTSLAFRAGAPVNENVIQWLDGLFSLSGLVAFYLLYRRRVSRVLVGLGALSVLAVSPLWLYLGSGYTDMPSVALTGWLLVALVVVSGRGNLVRAGGANPLHSASGCIPCDRVATLEVAPIQAGSTSRRSGAGGAGCIPPGWTDVRVPIWRLVVPVRLRIRCRRGGNRSRR